MRIVFDCGVAIRAAQTAVHAGSVLGGIDGEALTCGRRHSRLAMAGETVFILVDGLRLGCLGVRPGGRRQQENNEKQTATDQGGR